MDADAKYISETVGWPQEHRSLKRANEVLDKHNGRYQLGRVGLSADHSEFSIKELIEISVAVKLFLKDREAQVPNDTGNAVAVSDDGAECTFEGGGIS